MHCLPVEVLTYGLNLQAVLEKLERPLLCSSIGMEQGSFGCLPDMALLMDEYAPRGLDFVVDCGQTVS